MKPYTTPIERAFELAQSGQYANVADIKAAVSAEGYAIAPLTGGTLMKQLRGIIAKHRPSEAAE